MISVCPSASGSELAEAICYDRLLVSKDVAFVYGEADEALPLFMFRVLTSTEQVLMKR